LLTGTREFFKSRVAVATDTHALGVTLFSLRTETPINSCANIKERKGTKK